MDKPMRRARIVSDGSVRGTRVEVDGVPLEGVLRAEFSVAWNERGRVVLELGDVPVDLTGDLAEGEPG